MSARLVSVSTAAVAPRPLPDWNIERGPFPPFTLDEEVISELEAAVRLDPRNAKYQNDFGAALFDSKNNPVVIGTEAEERAKADAEAALMKAVDLEPNNPVFLHNLGNVLNSQDRWAEAEAVFRKAAELEPEDVPHHVGLFTALSHQNKLADAARLYLKIQRLKPDDFSKELLSAEVGGNKALKQEIKRLKKGLPK